MMPNITLGMNIDAPKTLIYFNALGDRVLRLIVGKGMTTFPQCAYAE